MWGPWLETFNVYDETHIDNTDCDITVDTHKFDKLIKLIKLIDLCKKIMNKR